MWQGVLAGLRAVGLMAALLLVPAALVPGGTWMWPRAFWFLGAYGATVVVGNVVLARLRPANFRVRRQSVVAGREKKQPLIDAVGAAMLVAYACVWAVLIPLDVFRLHLFPRPPAWISAAGGAAVVVGATITYLAMWQNPFLAPNVQDQSASGQRVVDSGLYGLVRHPYYAGNLLLFSGMALWLESYAALIGVAVLLVATIGRILVEERYLSANLDGYDAYRRRVRGRLIPFVL